MPLNASPSRPTSSLPSTGTSTSRRPERSTSVAARVSRTSGPVTVVAISQPSAAAADGDHDDEQDRAVAQVVEDPLVLLERAGDLQRVARPQLDAERRRHVGAGWRRHGVVAAVGGPARRAWPAPDPGRSARAQGGRARRRRPRRPARRTRRAARARRGRRAGWPRSSLHAWSSEASTSSSRRVLVARYDTTPTEIVVAAAIAARARAMRQRRLMRLTRGCRRRLAGRVPDAADGLDQPRLALGLGLAAQVADVDGEVLGVGAEVVVPDAVVDRRVVEDDALVAHEQLEQVELGLRQVQLAGAAPRPPRRRVEAEVGELHRLGVGVGLGLGCGAAGRAAGPAARRARTASAGSRRRRHRARRHGRAVSVRAVSMRIGTRLPSARSTLQTVSPSTIGIDTSSTTTSGDVAPAASSASAPLPTAVTV